MQYIGKVAPYLSILFGPDFKDVSVYFWWKRLRMGFDPILVNTACWIIDFGGFRGVLLDNGYISHKWKRGPSGAHYYFCFNLSLIIESYLEYQYIPVESSFSALLITVPVYTAFKSRTTANIITKRRRSFAFAFECRRSSRRTNN